MVSRQPDESMDNPTPRIVAFLLILSLTLPSPSFALRIQGPASQEVRKEVRAGLEEGIVGGRVASSPDRNQIESVVNRSLSDYLGLRSRVSAVPVKGEQGGRGEDWGVWIWNPRVAEQGNPAGIRIVVGQARRWDDEPQRYYVSVLERKQVRQSHPDNLGYSDVLIDSRSTNNPGQIPSLLGDLLKSETVQRLLAKLHSPTGSSTSFRAGLEEGELVRAIEGNGGVLHRGNKIYVDVEQAGELEGRFLFDQVGLEGVLPLGVKRIPLSKSPRPQEEDMPKLAVANGDVILLNAQMVGLEEVNAWKLNGVEPYAIIRASRKAVEDLSVAGAAGLEALIRAAGLEEGRFLNVGTVTYQTFQERRYAVLDREA